MATYVHHQTHSGSETVTNQLDATAVARAGARGEVMAAFSATLGEFTATLRGRHSGKEIIPSGSHPNKTAPVNTYSLGRQDLVFEGRVEPNEELELEIIASAAGDSDTLIVTK